MVMRKLVILGLLLLTLALAGPALTPEAFAVCGDYDNSSAHYFEGYGWACSYTGGHCSECTGYYSGGYTVCVGDSSGYTFCTDYQY